MDAPATLVWIAPEPPDAEQARALASWQRAHGVTLAPPGLGRTRSLPVDPSAADDVEAALDRARDALSARDGAAADGALSAAEVALRAQPQLPQSAWLMAEVLRVRAARLERVAPADRVASERAWQEAAALDGGRVAGLGERAAGTPPAAATLALDDVPLGAEARLDGRPVAGGSVETHAGPHVVTVMAEGAPVWARWVDLPAGTTSVRVDAPVAPACSGGDVGHARLSGDDVDASHVHCGAWVVAAPAGEGVRIALCEPGHCGALVSWRAPAPWTRIATPEPKEKGGWPTWATWGLVGAGAVAASAVVIIASGVFAPTPTETRFVTGGVRTR